jgi:hypothetical protein
MFRLDSGMRKPPADCAFMDTEETRQDSRSAAMKSDFAPKHAPWEQKIPRKLGRLPLLNIPRYKVRIGILCTLFTMQHHMSKLVGESKALLIPVARRRKPNNCSPRLHTHSRLQRARVGQFIYVDIESCRNLKRIDWWLPDTQAPEDVVR